MDGKLRRLREQRSLSQEDLARESGVNVMTIHRAEKGITRRLRPSTRRKLARALGVEPQELLTEQGRLEI